MKHALRIIALAAGLTLAIPAAFAQHTATITQSGTNGTATVNGRYSRQADATITQLSGDGNQASVSIEFVATHSSVAVTHIHPTERNQR